MDGESPVTEVGPDGAGPQEDAPPHSSAHGHAPPRYGGFYHGPDVTANPQERLLP